MADPSYPVSAEAFSVALENFAKEVEGRERENAFYSWSTRPAGTRQRTS
jgi:hypothetical protein